MKSQVPFANTIRHVVLLSHHTCSKPTPLAWRDYLVQKFTFKIGKALEVPISRLSRMSALSAEANAANLEPSLLPLSYSDLFRAHGSQRLLSGHQEAPVSGYAC